MCDQRELQVGHVPPGEAGHVLWEGSTGHTQGLGATHGEPGNMGLHTATRPMATLSSNQVHRLPV